MSINVSMSPPHIGKAITTLRRTAESPFSDERKNGKSVYASPCGGYL